MIVSTLSTEDLEALAKLPDTNQALMLTTPHMLEYVRAAKEILAKRNPVH